MLKVNVLLGDTAQVDPSGKVHALGLGWTRTTTPTGPMAIVVLVEFAATEVVNRSPKATITLIDDQGELVDLSRFGVPSAAVEVSIDLKRDNVDEGPTIAPLVIQTGPLPLEGNRTYRWQVSVDGHSEPSWQASFATTPPAEV